MLYKMFSAAVFAAVLGPFAASAQNIAQIGGPAERPPASFKGLQYVDSRGCVFMRVESSGAAQWYPRVDAQRKPVCNRGAATAQAAAPAAVPMLPVVQAAKPQGPAAKAPLATVASRMMPEALAKAAPAVAPATDVAAASATQSVQGPAKGKIACSASAPVLETVQLRNGGTGVMCTKGDGTTNGWHAPSYPIGTPPGASLRVAVVQEPVAAKPAPQRAIVAPLQAAAAAKPSASIFTPPAGYKLAWKDDRLNPKRGIGTAQGQAAQDRVWTRRVPAQIVAAASPAIAPAAQVTISSMNAASQAIGGRFVQIGTFGLAANATGAAERLQALGLPVAKRHLLKAGKPLQVVLSGPFGSADQAQTALRLARQAGFGDAFLR